MKRGENTLAHVKAALVRNGYDCADVKAAKFSKMNKTGDEVHVIDFVDITGNIEKGKVYIKDGKAEF